MKSFIKNVCKGLLMPAFILIAISFPNIHSYGHLDVKHGDLTSPYLGGAYVVFAGKTGGLIKKSEVEAQREVRVDGCAKGYKVMNFTLEITKGNSKLSFESRSNLLTKEMQTNLQSLTKGDTFEFKQMKAQQEDKHIVDVQGNKFTIG